MDNGVIKCLNCFHHCILEPGPPKNPDPDQDDPRASMGICGIRHNYKGDLYLMDHSYPKEICADHIEKTPFFHFLPGVKVLYIGMIGCNMRCKFCQSWEIAQLAKLRLKRMKNSYIQDIESIISDSKMTPKMIVKKALKEGCKVIEFNVFNEPTMSFDNFFLETAKESKRNGLLNIICSNGYQSIESIQLVAPYIDAINIGLKACTNKFYSRLCGVRLYPILRNIKIWRELGVYVEVQTLLIPNENITNEEIETLVKFIYSVDPNMVLHFARYIIDYLYLEEEGAMEQTDEETFLRAYEIAKKVGLKYVYSDHENHKRYHSTWCPKCDNLLVKRGWKDVKRTKWSGDLMGLNEKGCCKKCGTVIHGYWKCDPLIYNPLVKKRLNKIPLKYYPRDLMLKRSVKMEGLGKFECPDKCIKILYASQTGVCEEYAKELKEYGDEEMKKSKISVKVIDLMNYEEKNIMKETFVLIVMSTWFFGRPPRGGDMFYNYIMKSNNPKLLKMLNYVVVGIGSTGNKKCHEKTYQTVPRNLDKKLKLLGGSRLFELFEVDKKKNFKKSLNVFKTKFWEIIKGVVYV